jgi:hypothetical protein
VAYSLTPGSAGSSDFDGSLASPPSPLGFLSGQASLQIKVPILPDAEDEALESFTITLSAPTDATLQGPPSATVEISDNDVAGRVQLASAAWSVAEGAGAATLTLKRSGGTAGEASVLCSTDDGAPETSATAGSDYTSTAQLVTFSAGQTSANCIISITGDAMAGEGAETVRVILTSPSFGVTIAAPAAGLLYIADDE